jgi:hypothetical protein
MSKRKPRVTQAAKAETSVQTSVVVKPLITQAHGGALLPGGTGAGGRPKEILRRRCREEIETRKGIEFVGRVMDGTETEAMTVTVGSGKDAHTEVVQVPAKIRDRLYAFELLMDRGFGKPEQGVTIEDERPRRTGEEVMAHILELLPRVIATLPVDRQEIARALEERRRIELLMSGQQVKDSTRLT